MTLKVRTRSLDYGSDKGLGFRVNCSGFGLRVWGLEFSASSSRLALASSHVLPIPG